MSDGLTTTFCVLADTRNEAAVDVLIPALDSTNPAIQEGALAAVLTRRSADGHREILRRFPDFNDRWKAIVGQHPGRLTPTLREAVLGADPLLCRNACQAAVAFREYDLIPTLLTAIEGDGRPNGDAVVETIAALVERLYEELAGRGEPAVRRDPQALRRFVLGALELSVQRFGRHRRREVIEAFLLLAYGDNATLQQILQNPHHVAFLVAVDVLTHSEHAAVVRLLLGFLDDPQAPSAALSVVGNRGDARFARHLLRKIGLAPAAAVMHNLKRMTAVVWLRRGGAVLEHLDDAAQQAAVRLAVGAAIPRQQAYETIEYLLLHGKTGGRREAARALADFPGAAANAAALQASNDADPLVQATAVAQLRSRNIPSALPRLVELLDSRHAAVRAAARESLAEFNFARFVGTYDLLDDEVRKSTGALVKRVDPQTVPLLKEELKSPMRTRRIRGLEIARLLHLADAAEEAVVALLQDEDHLIRAEAAATLAAAHGDASYRALEEALHDRSPTVQDAAGRSLRSRAKFVHWQQTMSESPE